MAYKELRCETGNRGIFRRKVFLGYLNGKKHYSIGKGSKYWDERPPRDEAWDYE